MMNMMMKKISVLVTTLLAIQATVTIAHSAAATRLTGAGATFPYPLYSKWFFEYQKRNPEAEINYQSIGSGGGIRQFTEGTIDFGASDAPMTDEQLAKLAQPAFHIPTVLGAVVLTYHVPGTSTGLKLTPDVLADIFLGKLTKWNDPRLTKLNPGVSFPDTPILVAHRSDGSGTTGIFTDYLSKVSPEWKKKVGQGTAVKWPVGLGGKGNEGVTGLVKQTPGAIGYVELIYAENSKLPYASVQNAAGHFTLPSMKSVSAAAAGALKTMPGDFRVSITNPPGKDSYPISGFTYLLVHQTVSGAKGRTLVEFLEWAVSDGQKLAEPLSYAPLPHSLAKKVEATIKKIQVK
ncbi:MAG: phosphate ABC transporter substrate-binding protein PstS [Bdellovibrionales bacterium GWB1_55_8]|nr:MAG: phosphate ABC transporter substrate-binding protein PstS [Bdellovibrionales bacterium GWB1_55_8]